MTMKQIFRRDLTIKSLLGGISQPMKYEYTNNKGKTNVQIFNFHIFGYRIKNTKFPIWNEFWKVQTSWTNQEQNLFWIFVDCEMEKFAEICKI